MPRVKRGSKRRQKRKKILARAKGYFQTKSKLYRYAKEAVDRAQKFAYIGRRLKKRDFRALWITRIGAATDQHGLSYSRFIHGLKLAGIDLNRKMLAEMAVSDADGFETLTELAKAALEAPPKAPPSGEASEAATEPDATPGTQAPAEPEAAAPEEAQDPQPEAAPETSKPETAANEAEVTPTKPRARKKAAASDEPSESEAPAAPAKKRAPAKKKPAASDDDSADT